jgi:hypothetical protein
VENNVAIDFQCLDIGGGSTMSKGAITFAIEEDLETELFVDDGQIEAKKIRNRL